MINLDDMAREAMSRVSYATAANAEWQKKKVAEGFAELRKSMEPQELFADPLRGVERDARYWQNMMMNASQTQYCGQLAGPSGYSGGIARFFGPEWSR